MKGLISKSLLLLLAGAALSYAPAAEAQQFLYTNDNVATANSTTVLRVGTTGALTVLETYSTGGAGSGNGSYYASQPIAAAQTSANWCLFVANAGSSSIAAFKINPKKGKLTAVSGSPFADGESGSQPSGISLAVGNGELLFAANSRFYTISVMTISSDCALSLASTIDLSYAPVALKATPNGNYLIASYLVDVDSFSIDYQAGTLTEIGPFPAQGHPAGVDIGCDSSMVFFGDANANTQVEVFAINSSGQLSEVDNFTDPYGSNSNNVLLSADQKKLYVTNNQSNQISVLAVGTNGHLSFKDITNLNNPGEYALGLATNKAGKLLFVSEVNNPESIGVLAAKGTTLTEVPNSPFGVIDNGKAPGAMVAVPPCSCP